MPVKSCQVNGEPGYKWGDEGKCYTGPDAKAKAYEQGKAIGDFASMKISFDFDDTLSLKKWQDEAIRLISEGNTLYIISARHDVSGMYDIADKVGIPHSRVYATGSNKDKIEKIKELGIDKHYDNNQDVINELKKLNISYIKAGEMAYEKLSRVINFLK